MTVQRTAIFKHSPGQQRGAALMVMLVIMIMGSAAFLISSLGSAALQIKRDETTANALAQAKDALIGRAVADLNHPGSLSCPDVDNDGMITIADYSGSNCKSLIGRLPYKTLGLPDLRDGSGERLWYALSPNFRDINAINSNSAGSLLVYDNSGTTLLTPPGSEAVAIIFAPGNVVASQQRDTAANQNLAQNYLDIGPNSINNAIAGGPFIAADKTSTFNDRMMMIRASDIIPMVEKRVAQDLTTAFANYVIANSAYPYPASFGSCNASSCPGDSTTPTCIGKVPVTDLAAFLPAYFAPNNWFDVIYYTMGTNSLTAGGGAGTGAKGWGKGGKWGKGGATGGGATGTGNTGTGCYAPTLVVSGTSVNGLFFMPGTPLGGIVRTSPGLSSSNLANYFEDTENQNLDDLYTLPGASSNDTLHLLP